MVEWWRHKSFQVVEDEGRGLFHAAFYFFGGVFGVVSDEVVFSGGVGFDVLFDLVVRGV